VWPKVKEKTMTRSARQCCLGAKVIIAEWIRKFVWTIYDGIPWLLWADSCQVNVQTQQGCTKDGPILLDWLIHSFETHYSAMGWTLIIASFEANQFKCCPGKQ